MSTAKEISFHSREIAPGDEIQTLANSLTLDQIRDAISRLSPTKRIPLRSHGEAKEALESTRKDSKTIEQTLLQVESETPFKHCLVFGIRGEADLKKLSSLGMGSYCQGKFNFSKSFQTSTSDVMSFTFEHNVSVREWVDIGNDTRKVEEFSTRHPVLVRLYPAINIAIFSYPGYSHGRAAKRASEIPYDEVMSSLQDFISANVGASFFPLAIQESIKLILDGPNTRVKVIGSDVDQRGGTIALTSQYEIGAVEDVLTNFIAPHLPALDRQLVIAAVKKAVAQAPKNSVVLYWIKEQVITRVKFWEIGAELLFIWHGAPTSFRIVNEIVSLFSAALSENIQQSYGGARKELTWLSARSSDEIITPALFAETFGRNAKEARGELMRAMRLGLILPVYRLRTSHLLMEIQNSWTENLEKLNRIFTTEAGEQIDGTDPNNIEVAFVRAKGKR